VAQRRVPAAATEFEARRRERRRRVVGGRDGYVRRRLDRGRREPDA
jgi:hypothetical protein